MWAENDSQLLPTSCWWLAADGWSRDKSSKLSCNNSWVKVFVGPCDIGQDNGGYESVYASTWSDCGEGWMCLACDSVLWIADGVIVSGSCVCDVIVRVPMVWFALLACNCYSPSFHLFYIKQTFCQVSKSMGMCLPQVTSWIIWSVHGAIHWAESFNNRALIRSNRMALLVCKVFSCLRTKDSVILEKVNKFSLPIQWD